MKKRIVTLLMAAVLMTSAVTGCSKFDGSEIVAEIDGVKVTADVANFYSRYQQAQYETYYAGFMGEDMWEQAGEEEKNYEETVKEGLLDALKTMYLIDAHKEDYGVSISEEESAAIKAVAKEFAEANGDSEKKVISGETKNVEEVLELLTIQEKMYEAMTADVDTEVSDDEAAQKKMQYIKLSLTTSDEEGNSIQLSEEELTALKTKADEFNTRVAAGEDFAVVAAEYEFEVQEATFDAEATSPAVEVVSAADTLGEGETTGVVETEAAYFVAKVTSLFDEDATTTKKQSIINERRNTAYEDLCKEWEEAADITIHKKVWKKIKFQEQGVTIKTVEKEDAAGDEAAADEGSGEETPVDDGSETAE